MYICMYEIKMRMLHFKGSHHPTDRLAMKMTDAHINGSGRTIRQHVGQYAAT